VKLDKKAYGFIIDGFIIDFFCTLLPSTGFSFYSSSGGCMLFEGLATHLPASPSAMKAF